MVVTLSVDKTTYRSGEPVTMTLHARNTSDQPVRHLRSGGPNKFSVADASGLTVWVAYWGQAFPTVAETETIQPGEEKTSTVVWKQEFCQADGSVGGGPARPGQFTVEGTWNSTGDPGGGSGWPAKAVTITVE